MNEKPPQGKHSDDILPKSSHVAIRIIDANLNRAREALRVMEEYARLGLDDADLTKAIKETRHELAKAVGEFEDAGEDHAESASARAEARGLLVEHRDIVGDVGCDVTTDSEYRRSNSADVAIAAGKRLSEALRAVEEYGKTIDSAFATAIERIRYHGYELERRLNLTRRARTRFARVRLYVILTESRCAGDWYATAEAALRGGVDCLQLREKELTDRELLARAMRLAALCRKHDAMFVVNDRPDIALLAGADGVHLGRDDMHVAAARRILPTSCVIGVSTHTLEQAYAAAAEVPDYIAVGPMFETATKPQDHIAGTETLIAVRRHTSLPLVAIGGITERNIAKVLQAAPCTPCVCRAVVAELDVTSAVRRLRKLIDRASHDRADPRTSRSE